MRVTGKRTDYDPHFPSKTIWLQPNVEVEFVAESDGIRIQKRGTGSANPFCALRGVVKKRLMVDRYIEDIRGR